MCLREKVPQWTAGPLLHVHHPAFLLLAMSSIVFNLSTEDRQREVYGGREWEKGKNGGKEEKRLINTVLPAFPSVFKKLYFLIYSFLLIISYSPSHSLQIYTDTDKNMSQCLSLHTAHSFMCYKGRGRELYRLPHFWEQHSASHSC